MKCPACADRFGGCRVCKPDTFIMRKENFRAVNFPQQAQMALAVKPAAPKPVLCPMGDPLCPCNERIAAGAKFFGVDPGVADVSFNAWAAPAPPKPRPQLADRITPALAKAGFERGQLLGGGAFAKVYAAVNDPTKVIKITSDESDACVAELARRRQRNGECRSLMRVYSVWRFTRHPSWADKIAYRYDGEDFYIIIGERLRKLTEKEKAVLPGHEAFIDATAGSIMRAAQKAAEGRSKPDGYYLDLYNWGHAAALNLHGICEDLRAVGCEEWTDFHLNNVMVRPSENRVVISDFGCSKSPVPEFEEPPL